MKKSKFIVIWFLVVIVFGLAACSSNNESAGNAGTYPEKDITLIVPHRPGGGIDTYARAIAPLIEKHLPNDVNIVVDNREGASGVTGVNYFAQLEPDGYTLGFMEPGGLYIQQQLIDVKYDVTEFNWLGQLRYEPAVTFATPDSPIQSVEQMMNEKVTINVPQLRTAAGISAAITFDEMGVDYGLLAGTGTADAVTALLRGDADLHHNNTGGVVTYVEDGEMVPLFVNSDEPYELWPDVPTVADLGYPELSSIGIFMAALTAPPGVPEEILEILHEAVWEAMNDPEFEAWSEEAGRPIVIADGGKTTENILSIADAYSQYLDKLAEIFAD